MESLGNCLDKELNFMRLKIINQDYHYGPVSDIKTIALGDVVTISCEAFPDEAAAYRAIDEGFAEEVNE